MFHSVTSNFCEERFCRKGHLSKAIYKVFVSVSPSNRKQILSEPLTDDTTVLIVRTGNGKKSSEQIRSKRRRKGSKKNIFLWRYETLVNSERPNLKNPQSIDYRAMSAQPAVTQLLKNAQNGDRNALDQLLPLVYTELRKLASFQLRRERANHTLQPTALVHEAYLRLVNQREVQWQDRAQFFGLAAQMMRRILVNYAIAHKTAKRGGDQPFVSLDEAISFASEREINLVLLDEALTRLAEIDPTQSQIVEMRFFGGLTVEEVASVMKTSTATVKREWRTAKAWLFEQIHGASV